MNLQRYVKGSQWRLAQDITVRTIEIPAGTVFESLYARRRSINGNEVNSVPGRLVEMPLERSKKSKKRKKFIKADVFLTAEHLSGSVLVNEPEHPFEYFIRDRQSGKYWCNRDLRTGFMANIPEQGNHYASLDNALTGVVTIAFRRDIKPDWEIAQINVLTGETTTHPLPQMWFRNVVNMSAMVKRMAKNYKGRVRITKRLRGVMSNLPKSTGVEWRYIVLGKFTQMKVREREAVMEEMTQMGIVDFFKADAETLLLANEDDFMLMKLKNPQMVYHDVFEVDRMAIS